MAITALLDVVERPVFCGSRPKVSGSSISSPRYSRSDSQLAAELIRDSDTVTPLPDVCCFTSICCCWRRRAPERNAAGPPLEKRISVLKMGVEHVSTGKLLHAGHHSHVCEAGLNTLRVSGRTVN